MGCDIHAHVEYKQYDQWWELADVHIGRNYKLFGLMAGVRMDIALIEPRGIPDDCGYTAKSDFIEWDTDAHTPSWLTYDEMNDVIQHMNSICTEAIAVLAVMKVMNAEVPTRIIFWFDN